MTRTTGIYTKSHVIAGILSVMCTCTLEWDVGGFRASLRISNGKVNDLSSASLRHKAMYVAATTERMIRAIVIALQLM
jgi:hypothetical protein